MSDTSTGASADSTLAASSSAGTPSPGSDHSSSTGSTQRNEVSPAAAQPDASQSLNGSAASSPAAPADATNADSRRESTEDNTHEGSTDSSDVISDVIDSIDSEFGDDPELAEEARTKPKLYGRFKEKNESAKAERARAEAAEAEAKSLRERLQQASPVLDRVSALPQVKPYLDAGIPIHEALELADANALRQGAVQTERQQFDEALSQWQQVLEEDPSRMGEFLDALRPVLAEHAEYRPIVADVQRDVNKITEAQTIDTISARYPGADKEDIATLVRSGRVDDAVHTADRQSKAAAARKSEMDALIDARVKEVKAEADRAAQAAVARYQAESGARGAMPVPDAGGNGSPGAPPSGSLSDMPQGDPSDPKFRAAHKAWMEQKGRETFERRGW